MSIDRRRVTKGRMFPVAGGEGEHEVSVSCWDYPVCVTIKAPSDPELMELALSTLAEVVDRCFPEPGKDS